MAIRACCSPFEFPVGKGMAMPGLLIAWPALTFAFKDCEGKGVITTKKR